MGLCSDLTAQTLCFEKGLPVVYTMSCIIELYDLMSSVIFMMMNSVFNKLLII